MSMEMIFAAFLQSILAQHTKEQPLEGDIGIEDFIDWLNSHESDLLLITCPLVDTITQNINLINKPTELITVALFTAIVDYIVRNYGGFVQSFGTNDNTYVRGLALLMEYLNSDQEIYFDPDDDTETSCCGCCHGDAD